MAKPAEPSTRLRLAAARHRDPVAFDIAPDPDACAAIAAELGASALRKVRFRGELRPRDRADWEIEAVLGATVVQPCDITLASVTTRIDEPVRRRYVAAPDPVEEPSEREIPEDVDEEPLPATLDLERVMIEALSLAIPAFPRSGDAAFGAETYAAPGVAPVDDDELKPFAGLRQALDRGD